MARRATNDPPSAKAIPPVLAADRACAGVDAALFFPERVSEYPKAAALCRRCPVQTECLAWALQTRQGFGMWGGKTPDERAALLAA